MVFSIGGIPSNNRYMELPYSCKQLSHNINIKKNHGGAYGVYTFPCLGRVQETIIGS
jgi:hypothetical protein